MPSLPPKSPSATPGPASPPDGYALAAARLNARRPLKDPLLQQYAAWLQQAPAAAEGALRQLAAQRPRDADAANLLAQALQRQGRRRQAIDELSRCLTLAPDHALARLNRANLLYQERRLDEAMDEIRRLLERDARNPLYRQSQASTLETLGRVDEAVEIFQQLATENRTRAESWLALGHALRAQGSRERCVDAYRMAIACRPSFGEAWYALANLRNLALRDEDVQAMLAQLQAGPAGDIDRSCLHYTLGKAYEQRGDFTRAFEQFALGNARMRAGISYDPRAFSAAVDHQKAFYTPTFLSERMQAGGSPSSEPIFILSRPRSGSTLLEQMLACHPAIEATAELPYIPALAEQILGRRDKAWGTAYLDALARLSPDERTALGEEYLRRARAHCREDTPYFIDKLPANFFHIGLIATLLPRARIIEVRRHPAATCVSIFKSFSSRGSLALRELGLLQRDYVRLLEHFHRVLPGRIQAVTYEDLVHEPRRCLHEVLEFLGLPFDEACLNFHESRRVVLTPSSEQVRRPLTTDAIDQWRSYEPWLAPLLEGLGSLQTAYPEVPAELREWAAPAS